MSRDLTTHRANPLVVFQLTEQGGVLMDVASGDCYELNQVGAEVWDRLVKGESEIQIVAALAGTYHLPEERATADVRGLILDLHRHGLVTPHPE